MRAGVDVAGEAGGLDRGTQKGAGRALAVGAGDMEHRRQALMRVAEPVEQHGDAFEAEDVGARGQRPEPIELCLDGGGD